jgi:hypothetical protein
MLTPSALDPGAPLSAQPVFSFAGAHVNRDPRRAVQAVVVSMALATCWTGVSRAQPVAGAATMSASEVADSLTELATLQRQARATPRDAALWFRIGTIAWSLTERAKAPDPPRDLDATRLARTADT